MASRACKEPANAIFRESADETNRPSQYSQPHTLAAPPCREFWSVSSPFTAVAISCALFRVSCVGNILLGHHSTNSIQNNFERGHLFLNSQQPKRLCLLGITLRGKRTLLGHHDTAFLPWQTKANAARNAIPLSTFKRHENGFLDSTKTRSERHGNLLTFQSSPPAAPFTIRSAPLISRFIHQRMPSSSGFVTGFVRALFSESEFNFWVGIQSAF